MSHKYSLKVTKFHCDSFSFLQTVEEFHAVETHCALPGPNYIGHRHVNGCFDWLFMSIRVLIIRENQFLCCEGNTKDLRLRLSNV